MRIKHDSMAAEAAAPSARRCVRTELQQPVSFRMIVRLSIGYTRFRSRWRSRNIVLTEIFRPSCEVRVVRKSARYVRCCGGWNPVHGRASEALPKETGAKQIGPTYGTRRQSSTRQVALVTFATTRPGAIKSGCSLKRGARVLSGIRFSVRHSRARRGRSVPPKIHDQTRRPTNVRLLAS